MKNEETFIKYLLEKRQAEKEAKRAMRLKRESEAHGGSMAKL